MTEARLAMARLLALGGVVAESRRVLVGDVDLHVLEAGEGPPLLLLHGGGGGAANWYRLMPGLAGFARVIAPDLPGFGLSPDISLRPPLAVQAARILAGLLDVLAIPRASVLGTSFGGLAGLRLAQHFPGRVERLVLLDSAGLNREVPWLIRLGMCPLLAPLTTRPTERGNRWLLRRWLTSTPLEPAHEVALVRWLTAVGAAHSGRALRSFTDWRGQREVLSAAELRDLAVPVLVVWGALDRFFPAGPARSAAAELRHARWMVLANAGHSPNWECPDDVLVQVRRFVADQPRCPVEGPGAV